MTTRSPAPLEPRVTRRRHAWSLAKAALAATLLVLPGLAVAASLKGKVTGTAKLLNPVWNEAKDPGAHRYSFREPSPTVRVEARSLTGFLPKELCVAALGSKGAPKGTAKVAIAGGRTSPVTLVVAPGQLIQFENQDPFPHRIYVVGGSGLPPGEVAFTKTRQWTPPGPGKFEVRDELAPSIRSWIVVEPRVVGVTFPERNGDFSIDLEPGKYALRGFFNGEPVGSELAITVTNSPDQRLGDPLIVGEAGKPADANKGGP
jgi:plastocyanin